MGGALGTLVPAWTWEYAGFGGVVWLCVGLVVLGSFGFWIQYHKEQRNKT